MTPSLAAAAPAPFLMNSWEPPAKEIRMSAAIADILATPYELSSRQFELALKKLADDLTYGSDASRFVGPGIDFAQTRPYTLGDSVRSIDWKVSARAGRIYVKEYEAPKRATVYIIVDTSSSMHASSTAISKHALAVWIAGTFAMVAFRRRSPVLLVSGGDRSLPLTPTLNRSQLWGSIEILRKRPEGVEPTRLSVVAEQLSSMADRTSQFIFISDLHESSSVAAIRRIAQRHDAMVLQLQDPAEQGKLGAGFFRASEAESGRGFMASSGSRFLHDRQLDRGLDFAQGRVEHILIRTDQPFIAALKRALCTRGGRRAAR
jgi:uncharacterized protein (DUF58 family)